MIYEIYIKIYSNTVLRRWTLDREDLTV